MSCCGAGSRQEAAAAAGAGIPAGPDTISLGAHDDLQACAEAAGHAGSRPVSVRRVPSLQGRQIWRTQQPRAADLLPGRAAPLPAR